MQIDDVVQDRQGVFGIILDTDESNYGYEWGVLFTDVDEDNGLWWCTDHETERNCTFISKIEKDSEKYKEFMKWYALYREKNMTKYVVGVHCPQYCDQQQIRDRDAIITADNEQDAVTEWLYRRRHWIRDDEKHLVKVLRIATNEDLNKCFDRYTTKKR